MKLIYPRDRFVCLCSFQSKHIPKQAGFRWDNENKCWWTDDIFSAAKLSRFADEKALSIIKEHEAKANANLEMSRAEALDVDLPKPDGLDYLPFQKAGIQYCLGRDNTLIADEMGLGKTIQGIGYVNCKGNTDTIKRVLVVCPASLKLNWLNEMNKWLVHPLSTGVAFSNAPWPKTDIVIINYDILAVTCQHCKGKDKKTKAACKHCDKGTAIRFTELYDTHWDAVIADEVHNIKNPQARKAKMFMKLKSDRKIALTGTPILNKPIELQSILAWLDKKTWGNRWAYANRYCGLYRDNFGVHMDGATNLDELQHKLRSTLMIRRLKTDVLKDLPPKFRQVIELPADGAQKAVEEEWKAYRNHEKALLELKVAAQLAKASDCDNEHADAVQKLKEGQNAAFSEMARMRVEIAKIKIPYMVAHLKDCLDHKVIAFANHHVVVDEMKKEFAGSVDVTGKTTVTNRQLAVERFQSDPKCMLFIGNIKAAGVGLTLTASSHVVFLELDWVPANLSQAEDRAHRIGQLNNVLVQHLVLEGSLDAVMAKRIIQKQAIIRKALDEDNEFEPEVYDEVHEEEPSAVAGVTRKQVVSASVKLTPDDVKVLHEAVRVIDGYCNGAWSNDGVGFSKIDVEIGKSFASQSSLSPKQGVIALRLANKYRGQLSEDLRDKVIAIKEK